jgi:hypothetical protein
MVGSMTAGIARSRRMSVTARVGAALVAAHVSVLLDLAPAAANAETPDADAVCSMDTGGTGWDTKPLNSNAGLGALRYLIGGICVELSGKVQVTAQRSNAPEPRVGPPTSRPMVETFSSDFRIEAARSTPLGVIKAAFEIDWNYASNTHADREPTLDEATIAYLGVTVGYAESLMNFWDAGSLQFNVSAPSRSTYLVSYRRSWTDALSTSVALEAGPPIRRGEITWQLPETKSYVTAQLNYDKDDWSFQAAAAVHEVEVREGRSLGSPLDTQGGWASTVGFTIPLAFVAEDDSFSAQFTYAVNSAIFLGTQQDVSFLTTNFPTVGPTHGFSGVASCLHNWSHQWTSTAYASYLELDVDLLPTGSAAKILRYGVDLTYEPNDDWTIGVELDYMDARIGDNGPGGEEFGQRVSGPTVSVWVKRGF